MFNMSNQSEKIFLKKSQANTLFYIQKKNIIMLPMLILLIKFHHQPKNQIKPLLEPKPSSS